MNKNTLTIFLIAVFITFSNAIAKPISPDERGESLVCPSGYINNRYLGVYDFHSSRFIAIRNDIVPNAKLIKSNDAVVAMWNEGDNSPSNAFVYKVDLAKGSLSELDQNTIISSLVYQSDSDLKLNAIAYSLSFKSMTSNMGRTRFDSNSINVYKLNSGLLGFNYIHTKSGGEILLSDKDSWYDPASRPIFGNTRTFSVITCDDNLFSLYSGSFFSLIKTNKYGENELNSFVLFIKSSVNPINEATNPDYFK